jgi:hypothetical protein
VALFASILYAAAIYFSTDRIGALSMLDIMFIAIGLGFLAGAMLYAVACDRL